ncbi:hypothetical protein PV10_08432 [Exophiala mesophila]|uniref:BTB domain-containing protein n=1 Tax=Exophiala mesophila TaxID=212818 RepID=A0A0D1ZPQ4_EXOME|nr:uncharacterized protein PV10_08432 [Exophiala mesophila]KIV88788.1 hypothetical protein PV10_08432 [Exophiala mesophila]
MSLTPRISIFDPDADTVVLPGPLQADLADEPHLDQAPANHPIVGTGPINEDSADNAPEHDFAGDELSKAQSTKAPRMQVSSKHLSLASKVFKNMFEDFSHGNKNTAFVDPPADDVDEMQIPMNVVHRLTRWVFTPPEIANFCGSHRFDR